jgi:ATP/maltotriose-dependent transcriptional regulator MalT
LKNLTIALESEMHFLYDQYAKDTSLLTFMKYQLLNERERNRSLDQKQKTAQIKNEVLETKLNQRNIIISSIVGFTILLILFVVIKIKSQRRKSLMEKNRVQNKLEKEIIKSELEYTKNELLSFKETNQIKNDLIKSIQSQLSANGNEEEKVKELKKMKILTNEDWDKFKQLSFRSFPNLYTIIPKYKLDLSESELRMLVLIKLNCSKIEIADMVGISNESVRKSIYRLKQKIKPIDLQELIDGLD